MTAGITFSTAMCPGAAAQGWIDGVGTTSPPSAGPTISASGRFVAFTTNFAAVVVFAFPSVYCLLYHHHTL